MKTIKTLLMIMVSLMMVDFTHAQTWTQANVANTNWSSIVSSADGSTLYASRGNTNNELVYTSTNSGGTWNQIGLPITNSVFGLAASADGTKVFVARSLPGSTPHGSLNSNPFFLSTNSGTTWNSVFEPTTNYQSSIAMSADGNTLIAGQWNNGAWIYISTNSGATWSTNQIGSLFPMVFAAADGQILSVLSSPKLVTTTNSGLTWTTNNLPGSPYSWNSIAASANGTILAAVGYKSSAGTYVCVSTNTGISWVTNAASTFTYFASGGIAMSSDGSKLMAPAFGALFISSNFGMSWSQAVVPSTNWWSVASSADGNKLAATVLGNTTFTKATGAIWTSQTTPSPQLNLTPSSTNLTLGWTVPSTNFVLQQSADLASWADVTNPPVLNLTNLQNQVTLPPSGSSGFYRLKTP